MKNKAIITIIALLAVFAPTASQGALTTEGLDILAESFNEEIEGRGFKGHMLSVAAHNEDRDETLVLTFSGSLMKYKSEVSRKSAPKRVRDNFFLGATREDRAGYADLGYSRIKVVVGEYHVFFHLIDVA